LFDFPHLSSFNACEEFNHLIILYPPVPRTHEYWEGHCPPNYYGGAALDCNVPCTDMQWRNDGVGRLLPLVTEGGTGKGPPTVPEFLLILMFVFVVIE